MTHRVPYAAVSAFGSAEDFVGCGGQIVTLSAIYDITASVYGYKVITPVLVVPGQTDDPWQQCH